MYRAFLIFLNKLITKVCKIFGKNGSVYPGYIIYDIFDKKILTKIKYPKYVIAVTGSSGKGSTTDLIYKILTANGLSVVYNKSGSNGVLGATTLILNNCNLKGEFQKDVLLLETDERHFKLIFSKNAPTHIVFTNITRDQPVRNTHPDVVFNDMITTLNNSSTIIINADDPKINSLKNIHSGPIVTYGVSKTNNSYIKPKLDVQDFAYCPLCNSKLNYDYYHYGHLGSYSCPNKDFERGTMNYEATNIDLKKKEFQVNENTIKINKDVLYAVYSTLAAYSVCNTIGINPNKIVKSINNNAGESKRGKVKKFNDSDFIMLESKNENALSYYQSLRYIKDYEGKKSVIIGFDNVSRRYKYNDLSWLYDVEFELLNDPNIEKIYCIGRFRYDVAMRLKLAKINEKKMVMVDNVNTLLQEIDNKNKETIFSIVCFDMTAIINKLLEEYNDNN